VGGGAHKDLFKMSIIPAMIRRTLHEPWLSRRYQSVSSIFDSLPQTISDIEIARARMQLGQSSERLERLRGPEASSVTLFVLDYITSVRDLLDELACAATSHGIGLVANAQALADALPALPVAPTVQDRLQVAYAFHRFIEIFDDEVQVTHRVMLSHADMLLANVFVNELLGKTPSQRLDTVVETTCAALDLPDTIRSLQAGPGLPTGAAGPEPVIDRQSSPVFRDSPRFWADPGHIDPALKGRRSAN
jgi:hypothetical protein